MGVACALVALAACGESGDAGAPAAGGTSSSATAQSEAQSGPQVDGHVEAPAQAPASASTSTEQDRLAGALSRDVVPVGSGGTVAVPGSEPAPHAGQERRVRVEVEAGLPLDGPAVARFVLATLNDPRGWAADGLAFSRTEGDADIVVVLASPETSARMCRPLVTGGTLSCREGDRAIITTYRWVNGMEDYGDDLTGYRRYVVNHEVGHVLGHGHASCPGAGQLAPVMQQQTKDVDPCVPNPWPYP